MAKINVCEFLKTNNLLALEKGEELRHKILNLLQNNKEIILDFEGYDYISSSFLNESIGKLIVDQELSVGELMSRVKLENISEDDEIDFQIAIENAKTRLHLIKSNIDPEEFYRANLPPL